MTTTFFESLGKESPLSSRKIRSSFKLAFGQWFTSKPVEIDDSERDPITQEPISDIFFVLERENGVTSRVDAVSLIDYILSTGDYTDPETRAPFSEETLQRLDIFGKRLGKSSVIEAKNTMAIIFEQQKDRRDTISSLENICGDSVSQMYDAVEAVNEKRETADDATIRLLTHVFPIFEDAFKQLLVIDPESARISASQFESFLVGPAKKKTKDPYGFLKIILNLFHQSCGQI